MAGWIRCYERAWLKDDLIAGFAVAALIVPKNLGYAGIAGIPLQNGLYAAAAGAILYAVFGTSRQISTGPSSGLAAVAASAVAVAGITGVQNVASFVAMITLVSGVLFLLLAVLKMGWIAQFLSRAVVTGFLFGAAIDVVIGELPKLTGTKATLLVGVLAGVLIGIGLSLIWLISVATRPPMPLLGREPGTQAFRELDEHPGDEQFPGIVVVRLDGGLFFATSDALEDRGPGGSLVHARHHRDRA